MLDLTKQYTLNEPARPGHGKLVAQLTRFSDMKTPFPIVGVINGLYYYFKEDDPTLVPYDPVTYYYNIYPDTVGTANYPFTQAQTASRGRMRIGYLVVHKSGRTRTLPADATCDPEACL